MQLHYRNLLLPLLVFFILPSISAQVQGISYTIAPGANYTWFNNRAGLNDAFMVGGRLGIGFGEFVELRGLYYQTVGGQLELGEFDLDVDDFDNTDVDLARYGAELKLNVGRGKLLPYILIGGGVQDIGRQGLDEAQNIYGTGGLGLTLSATDRFTFSVESSYLAYRFNAVRNLLDAAERDVNNLDLDNIEADDLGNFTIGANLAFYLGGRKPGTLSAIDQAYLNAFGNGIKGLRIPVEIDFAHVNFDDGLAYRDAWFAGAKAGLDFGPYVGIRAFYYQGMQDNALNFNFDDLAMYGLDFRLNLSRTGFGFTPFVLLGGGRINVQDGYASRGDVPARSQGFAKGGLGLSFQLAKTLQINGSYNLLLTSQENFGEISNTDQLTSSDMFSLGLNLAFGNSPKPKQRVSALVQDSLNQQAEVYEGRLDRLQQQQRQRTARMKEKYSQRIARLEADLDEALETNDRERADSLRLARDQARMIVMELEERDQWSKRYLSGRPDNSVPTTYPTQYTRDYQPTPRSTAPTNNQQDLESKISLSFTQILQLVEAANKQPVEHHYYGSSGPTTSSLNRSVPETTSTDYGPAEKLQEHSDFQKELIRRRDAARENEDLDLARRYDEMIEMTSQNTYQRSIQPTTSGTEPYDATGSDYSRNSRTIQPVSNDNPPTTPTGNKEQVTLPKPETMRAIKGFDPDAQQPQVEELEKERKTTGDNFKARKKDGSQ